MFRTLKWVYALGVRQERVRIASHLQRELRSLEVSVESSLDALRGEKTGKDRKRKVMLQHAVDNRLQEIISNILQPKEEWGRSKYSKMFPNDNISRKLEKEES